MIKKNRKEEGMIKKDFKKKFSKKGGELR